MAIPLALPFNEYVTVNGRVYEKLLAPAEQDMGAIAPQKSFGVGSEADNYPTARDEQVVSTKTLDPVPGQTSAAGAKRSKRRSGAEEPAKRGPESAGLSRGVGALLFWLLGCWLLAVGS
jgi:hypothetical protein